MHKGPTVYPLSADAFDVHDVDYAATDFPELNFIVEHVGLPRLDDFCWIAAQRPTFMPGSRWQRPLSISAPVISAPATRREERFGARSVISGSKASGHNPAQVVVAADRPGLATALPPVWHVPYPRNSNFAGRSEAIIRLKEELLSGQTAAVIQAIAGLGGVVQDAACARVLLPGGGKLSCCLVDQSRKRGDQASRLSSIGR